MSPLVAGVIVVAVLAALIAVFRGRGESRDGVSTRSWTRAATLDRDAVSEVARLRGALDEIAFDRASGKLADADYDALRKTYETALARASTASPIATKVWEDAEGLVARARAEQRMCPSCGPRPENMPPYCSSCGLHLLACRACGARPGEIGARFCSHCGSRLAA
ncbi:MAG: zinc ribbon domain-containing protein [Gemmatimonadaceae bacterium]